MNKNYEMTLDENGKIVALAINGKGKAMRDINKAQNTSYWKLYKEGGVGRNPFTGVTVDLDPLELSIYGFCLAWMARYNRQVNTEVPVQVYDNMKYMLGDLNPNAYMDLIN